MLPNNFRLCRSFFHNCQENPKLILMRGVSLLVNLCFLPMRLWRASLCPLSPLQLCLCKGGLFLGRDCRGLGEWSAHLCVLSQVEQVKFLQGKRHLTNKTCMQQSSWFQSPSDCQCKNVLSQKLHQNHISIAMGYSVNYLFFFLNATKLLISTASCDRVHDSIPNLFSPNGSSSLFLICSSSAQKSISGLGYGEDWAAGHSLIIWRLWELSFLFFHDRNETTFFFRWFSLAQYSLITQSVKGDELGLAWDLCSLL